jgi:hypothetical protein
MEPFLGYVRPFQKITLVFSTSRDLIAFQDQIKSKGVILDEKKLLISSDLKPEILLALRKYGASAIHHHFHSN